MKKIDETKIVAASKVPQALRDQIGKPVEFGSETLWLRKFDIDFQRGLIHVTKTKSKQARIVPLNSVSRKIAERMGEDILDD